MVFFLLIAGIFGVEYFMKKHMDEVRTLKEQRLLAGGKLVLKKYYNAGACGNFLNSSPKTVLCIHAAVLGGVVAELLRLFFQKGSNLAKWGLAFLAGGGCSNLHDRLTKGYVIDYVSFGFGPKRLQKLVFNLADFFIFAGTLLVSLAWLCKKKKEG